LALLKLGQKEKADEQFNALLEIANKKDNAEFSWSFDSGLTGDSKQAKKEYLKGLAYIGMGRKDEAKSEFLKALELDPSHLWAQANLNSRN